MMQNVNQVGPTGSLTYYMNGPDGLVSPSQFSQGTPQASQPGAPSSPSGMVRTPMVNDRGKTVNRFAPAATGQQATSGGAPASGQSGGGYNWRDPFTGQTYNIPTFTAVTRLSPEQQALFDQNTRTQQGLGALAETQTGRLQNTLDRDFSPESLPEFGRIPGADDFSEDRQRVEDAIMQRMNPQIEADRARMETQLANQGIGMGARAFGAAQDDFGRNVNDARLGAILAGGQEQSRMQGLAMQAAGMQDGQRAQSLQEQLAMRNQPINEITALLSGSQVSMPNFQVNRPAGIPTTDTAGLINQNFAQRQGNYQQQMGQWNSTMGGLFGMGAAFLGGPR